MKPTAWRGSYRRCLDPYHSTKRRQSSSDPSTRSVQVLTRAPFPPSGRDHSDENNADLWVLVGLLGPFDGCLPECLWVWRNTTEPRFLFSPFWASFSRINSDLLTRKRKQVDRPESGHKNIYCCGWNVRNVAALFQRDVGPVVIILSFL